MKLFPTSFKDKTWDEVQSTRTFMAWVAAIFGFVAIGLGFTHFDDPLDWQHKFKIIQAGILVLWIIAPPIWFWYEFFFLYKRTQDDNRDKDPDRDFDRFKFGQDQSAKIWLALVTVLFGLYFGKDFKRESKSSPVQQGPPPASSPCIPPSNPSTTATPSPSNPP